MEQMPSNTPVMESKPGPAGWVQTWIKAVTKPNEQTFIDISESPDAKIQTALIWAAIAGLISGVVIGMGFALQQLIQGGNISDKVVTIAVAICGFPIAMAVINPIALSFSTALFQWVAKLFGGVGTFEKLIYPISAITVPMTIVSSVFSFLSSIPLVGACLSIFSIAISIYATVLNIMAVKAVNRFDWGQAIASVLIPAFVIGIFCGCIVFIGMMAFMPVISNAFGSFN